MRMKALMSTAAAASSVVDVASPTIKSVVGRLDRRRQAIDQTGKVRTLRHIGGARQRGQTDGVIDRQANHHLDNPQRALPAPILRQALQRWRLEPRPPP